jgi:predicted SAM-dependent methyltransferase
VRRVLHAGSGGAELPPLFGDCEEVRLDLDPSKNPDIVASILDLGDIGPFDAIYTSHTLEHIYPHEVPIALREFRRVLTDDGYALIFVPDLEGLTLSTEVLYWSPAGPVTSFDMIYGMRKFLATNPDTMAHRTGFTSKMLEEALVEAGFSKVTMSRVKQFNLMAVAQR